MTKTTWLVTGVLVLTFFSTAVQAQNTDSESAKSSAEVVKNDLEPEVEAPYPNPAKDKIKINVKTYKHSSNTFLGCFVSSILGELIVKIPIGKPKYEDDEVQHYFYEFDFDANNMNQEGLYIVECKYRGSDKITLGTAFRIIYAP